MNVATLPTLSPSIPYPGLRPFEAADQPVFFGRESQISNILRQLEDHRFVAVVGSSGSGKSSLVRAGLLPAMREGFLFSVTDWVTLIIKPGNVPYERLATALCQSEETLQWPVPGDTEKEKKALSVDEALTLATLQKSERGLINALKDAGMAPNRHVMVVVDQFEELFAFRRATSANRREVTSRDEAAAFVNMLLRSCEDPEARIWVVLTMRSDFIGNCEAFLGLPEAVSRSQFLVPRLNRKQMEEAIKRPGEIKLPAFRPFCFEQDLVNRIVNDAGDRPDQLPLMQHALMRTWKRAAKRKQSNGELTLTLDDYRKVGGIEEALSKHADEAWNRIKKNPYKARIARRLFLLLCDVSPDGQIIRRRPQFQEVIAATGASSGEVEAVMQEFQEDDRNFLLPPPGQPLRPNTYLDVSHEALLRRWHLFSEWLREEREAVAELGRLVHRAKGGALLQTKELDRLSLSQADYLSAPEWAKRYVTADQWFEVQTFLAKSAEEVKRTCDREIALQKQQANLKKGAALILLVAFAVSLFFMFQARQAAEKAKAAAWAERKAFESAHLSFQQAHIAVQQAQHALTDSFFRTIGVSRESIPSRDEREALWELAQLDNGNAAVRSNLLSRWFGAKEAFARGDARNGQGFRAVTGLNMDYHRIAGKDAADLGLRLVAILENPQQTDYDNLSSLTWALRDLAARFQPQTVAEIANRLAKALENPQDTNYSRLKSLNDALSTLAIRMEPEAVIEVAKGLATALDNPQETNYHRLTSLGDALATLAARMPPPAAAEFAKRGAQRIAVALENPQETDNVVLSSLGTTLEALAAEIEPPAAAEFAARGTKRLATALENTLRTNLGSTTNVSDALEKLSTRLEPQAAAEIAKGLATALENTQDSDDPGLSSLGDALALVAARMEPQAAADIAKRGAQRIAAILENLPEANYRRFSSLGNTLAALAARMEPQAAAEIVSGGAQRLAEALEKPPLQSDCRMTSELGKTLVALMARMEPPASADLAKRGGQAIATALESPQVTYLGLTSSLAHTLAALATRMEPQAAVEIATRSVQFFAKTIENTQTASLSDALSIGIAVATLAPTVDPRAAAEILEGLAATLEKTPSMSSYPRWVLIQSLRALTTALTSLAARMEPQAAAETAKGLAETLENNQPLDSDRLSSLGNALATLAARLEPRVAVAIADGLATALQNTQGTDHDRLSSLGSALAALAARMEPQAAAEIAKRGARSLAAALKNPQEVDSVPLWSLGKALASLCTFLPSADRTHLLALSNLLLAPVAKKELESNKQPDDRQLVATVCAQLSPQNLAEVLKYPFSTGEAEQIVLNELEKKTGQRFDGNIWNFVEKAASLGIKDIGIPANRPSAEDALQEL